MDALYGEGGECGGRGEEDVRRVLEEVVSAVLERRCAREIGLEEGGDGGGDGGFGRDQERRPSVDLVDEGGGWEEEENGNLLAVGPLDREEGEEESERPGAKEGLGSGVSDRLMTNFGKRGSTDFPSPVDSLASTSRPLMMPWMSAVWNAVGSTISGNCVFSRDTMIGRMPRF